MNCKYAVFLLAAAVPFAAFGQGAASYQCSHGDLQRRVEILTEPGVTVPCEVHYHKDTEAPGERQVLWSAASEEGYCERKTEEFIAKLRGWGWDCGPVEAAMPGTASDSDAAEDGEPAAETDPAAEAEADDTDALAPAGETEASAEE